MAIWKAFIYYRFITENFQQNHLFVNYYSHLEGPPSQSILLQVSQYQAYRL